MPNTNRVSNLCYRLRPCDLLTVQERPLNQHGPACLVGLRNGVLIASGTAALQVPGSRSRPVEQQKHSRIVVTFQYKPYETPQIPERLRF